MRAVIYRHDRVTFVSVVQGKTDKITLPVETLKKVYEALPDTFTAGMLLSAVKRETGLSANRLVQLNAFYVAVHRLFGAQLNVTASYIILTKNSRSQRSQSQLPAMDLVVRRHIVPVSQEQLNNILATLNEDPSAEDVERAFRRAGISEELPWEHVGKVLRMFGVRVDEEEKWLNFVYETVRKIVGWREPAEVLPKSEKRLRLAKFAYAFAKL